MTAAEVLRKETHDLESATFAVEGLRRNALWGLIGANADPVAQEMELGGPPSRASLTPDMFLSISVQDFRAAAQSNLAPYPLAFGVWWPIIEARAKLRRDSATDILLNPLFRWAYLNRTDRLRLFEQQAQQLHAALGAEQFCTFRDTVAADLSRHAVENQAHNRLLSAMAEIRGILRFTDAGYQIRLLTGCSGRRSPDFVACKDATLTAVEAKYIRGPDKLAEYLMRWWEAARDVAGRTPLDPVPYIKFNWHRSESRNELSEIEIQELTRFFGAIFTEPVAPRELHAGMLHLDYSADRDLSNSLVPLDAQAASSEQAHVSFFEKLRRTFDGAAEQLAGYGDSLVIFVLLNLDPEIAFLWPEHFEVRFAEIQSEFKARGIQILAEEVGYL